MATIDYSANLKRSMRVAWETKWLWIYGMIVSIATTGSGSGGSSSSSSPKTSTSGVSSNQFPDPRTVFGDTARALGDWFTSVPLTTWILLIVGFLILVILGAIISWIVNLWARGGLIAGTKRALDGESVTLVTTAPDARRAIRTLFPLQMLFFGISVAALFVVGLVGFLSFGIAQVSQIALVIWLVAIIPLIIFGGFVLTIGSLVVSMFAERFIILRNKDVMSAVKLGMKFGQKHFWTLFIQGLVNQGVGCAGGCVGMLIGGVLLGPIGVVVYAVTFRDGFHFPPMILLIIGAICLLVYGYATTVLRAILTVVTYANWQQLFDACVAEEGSV